VRRNKRAAETGLDQLLTTPPPLILPAPRPTTPTSRPPHVDAHMLTALRLYATLVEVDISSRAQEVSTELPAAVISLSPGPNNPWLEILFPRIPSTCK